jgi:hypothetical protein
MSSMKGLEMRDDFAAKLIAGKAVASAKASWWPRHCRALGRYLVLSGGGTPNALGTVRDELAMGWAAWEAAVPAASKKGLMEHHTELEMALVDAALMNNDKKIEEIGGFLLENATRQADVCAESVPGFPKKVFLKLLQEHVFLFVKAVRAHREGRGRACEGMEHANTLALAAFTAEWL